MYMNSEMLIYQTEEVLMKIEAAFDNNTVVSQWTKWKSYFRVISLPFLVTL